MPQCQLERLYIKTKTVQDKTVNLHSFFMTKTSDTSPDEGNITPESPLRTAGRHSSKLLNHSLEGWHPSAFHLPHGILCNRPPPHAHVNFARCLCRHRHMPMSLWRHAYVTLARCLCHHLRHAYVAEVRCLCRQSDIGMSPAPHQKRPVYQCSGCPFFVLFGHFRHEMRILRGLQ